MTRQTSKLGFTIVELLIVIVVIAILAAIGIIAYNGIQERARVSRASSQLSQTAKKIALWQVDNPGAIPANLSSAGITNSPEATYQYRRYDSNSTYCISVTLDGNNSYYSSSTSPSSVSPGSCTEVASVAGLPLALNSTPGTNVSFPALSGTPDVTLYAVFEINNTNDAWFPIAAMMPAGTGKNFQLDTADTGSNHVRYRIDTSTTTNATSSQGARTVGKHIGWVQVRSNMTVREFAYDKAETHTTLSMSPGDGWDFSQLRLGITTSSTRPIATVAYKAAHDQPTRARVMQWLADTYDVPMTF